MVYFNPQNEITLDLSNHTIQCYVCRSMLKGSKVEITFDPFNIPSIEWYGWKGLSLSFPKLFWIENHLNIEKVMSKNVYVTCFNIT